MFLFILFIYTVPYQIMTLANKLCASQKINTKQLENRDCDMKQIFTTTTTTCIYNATTTTTTKKKKIQIVYA